MKKENIRSTCGFFTEGKIDNPCCSACPACNCHMENTQTNKEIEKIVRKITDDIWYKMKISTPFKMDYVAEVLRQALLSREKAVEERERQRLRKLIRNRDVYQVSFPFDNSDIEMELVENHREIKRVANKWYKKGLDDEKYYILKLLEEYEVIPKKTL